MITLNNMIYANPQAYQVFPEMINPSNIGTTEKAEYSGYLDIVEDGLVVKLFTGTNTIDLSEFATKRIRIDNITDRGSVVLGEWDFSKDMAALIMPSMILWYDIKRQGATNESMAADPVLKDLSGNGHDATCYNFAWAGMSGIGGYNVDFLSDYTTLNYISCTGTTFVAKPGVSGGWFIHTQKSSPSFTIKVTGLSGIEIRYCSRDSEGNEITTSIKEDGIYTLPESVNPNNDYCGFIYGLGTSSEFTIELLPLYPNALVSDGVDDYAMVEGLPLFTPETGYTVIAKRKWIVTGLGAVCSKMVNNDGAFQLERVQGIVEHPNNSVSFNQYLPVTVNNDDVFIYQTTYNYNGVTELTIQDVLDTDRMSISAVITTNYSRYSGIALYSLLLFDRDLTTDEIEWVKTNLIS